MNTSSNKLVILSSNKQGNKRNGKNHILLGAMLQDCKFKFKECQGVYNGIEESSYIVKLSHDNEEREYQLETLKDFAFKNFNQESILHIDSNNAAYLYFNDNSVNLLGKCQQVTKNEALNSGNYTLVNGIYYATKKIG